MTIAMTKDEKKGVLCFIEFSSMYSIYIRSMCSILHDWFCVRQNIMLSMFANDNYLCHCQEMRIWTRNLSLEGQIFFISYWLISCVLSMPGPLRSAPITLHKKRLYWESRFLLFSIKVRNMMANLSNLMLMNSNKQLISSINCLFSFACKETIVQYLKTRQCIFSI